MCIRDRRGCMAESASPEHDWSAELEMRTVRRRSPQLPTPCADWPADPDETVEYFLKTLTGSTHSVCVKAGDSRTANDIFRSWMADNQGCPYNYIYAGQDLVDHKDWPWPFIWTSDTHHTCDDARVAGSAFPHKFRQWAAAVLISLGGAGLVGHIQQLVIKRAWERAFFTSDCGHSSCGPAADPVKRIPMTLRNFGMSNNSTVHSVLRLRGGCFGPAFLSLHSPLTDQVVVKIRIPDEETLPDRQVVLDRVSELIPAQERPVLVCVPRCVVARRSHTISDQPRDFDAARVMPSGPMKYGAHVFLLPTKAELADVLQHGHCHFWCDAVDVVEANARKSLGIHDRIERGDPDLYKEFELSEYQQDKFVKYSSDW
eukprot:TRINITY_DN4541_c0_g1_i4.p1 TRINITY_DN4541_c0_g1~~TRINITY_DN4541_c0_g1_i4.p1  ORF type:complete len:372 (-),score=60.28 TRINITY_DN4541_c0_g1_i4:255-1370(-)